MIAVIGNAPPRRPARVAPDPVGRDLPGGAAPAAYPAALASAGSA